MMLISPKWHKIHCAIHFGFKVLNNKAGYEALIASFCITHKLQVHNVKIFSNSHLVVNQVNDIYLARGEKTRQMSNWVYSFPLPIEVIPQSKNSNADALAKLVLTRDTDLLDAVSLEFLAEPISTHNRGNGANTRTIMDGPHRCVPENWWENRGLDKSSNPLAESSSRCTLRR